MSIDCPTEEEINQRVVRNNYELFNSIGRVKRRTSDNHCLENGVDSTFFFRTPILYRGREYNKVHVVSYALSSALAQTLVFGMRTDRDCALGEDPEPVFPRFCRRYVPSILPWAHKKTVDTVERLHYHAYLRQVRKNSTRHLPSEAL